MARFLTNPWTLFIVSLVSWPVLLTALITCAWLNLPHLALYLTSAIVAVGFACSELSVLDCGQSLYRQRRQLFAAFCCWAVWGIASLRLFSSLSQAGYG